MRTCSPGTTTDEPSSWTSSVARRRGRGVHVARDGADGVAGLDHVVHARGEHRRARRGRSRAPRRRRAERVAGHGEDGRAPRTSTSATSARRRPTAQRSRGVATLASGRRRGAAELASWSAHQAKVGFDRQLGGFATGAVRLRPSPILPCSTNICSLVIRANRCSIARVISPCAQPAQEPDVSRSFRPTRPNSGSRDRRRALDSTAAHRSASARSRARRIRCRRTSAAHSGVSASSGWSWESVTWPSVTQTTGSRARRCASAQRSTGPSTPLPTLPDGYGRSDHRAIGEHPAVRRRRRGRRAGGCSQRRARRAPRERARASSSTSRSIEPDWSTTTTPPCGATRRRRRDGDRR